MKVILRSDITNVGRQGEIKEVATGFARNYLVPRKLVMDASPQNLKIWEREKEKLSKQREEVIAAAKDLAAKLEAIEFSTKVSVGENGKIFGSVTTAHLAKVFASNSFEISKRDILLSAPIKEVGAYDVSIRLHPEVVAKVKITVLNDKD